MMNTVKRGDMKNIKQELQMLIVLELACFSLVDVGILDPSLGIWA